MPNSWINRKVRDEIYKRDSSLISEVLTPVCCYCNEGCITGIADSSVLSRHDRKRIATLDHIVPQFILAQDCTSDSEFFEKRRDPKNLVVVCVGCNSSKQHTDLETWCNRTNRDYTSIKSEIDRRVSIGV